MTAQEKITQMYKDLKTLEEIVEKGLLPDNLIDSKIRGWADEMGNIVDSLAYDSALVAKIKDILSSNTEAFVTKR